jgi:gas vesicle protein
MNGFMKMAATVLTGAAIGGGVALMYAPASGSRSRRMLSSRYRRLKDEVDRLSLVVSEQATRVKSEVIDSLSKIKTEVRQSAASVSTE